MSDDRFETICIIVVIMTFIIGGGALIYRNQENKQELRKQCIEAGNPPAVCAPLIFDQKKEKE